MAEHDSQDEEHDYRQPDEQERQQVTRPSRDRMWRNPATMQGAVLCAVVGGLIVWFLVTGLPYLISHLVVSISWH